MYIQPNTNIHILKGVPLDNSYKHTIYFDDRVKQYNYFYGKKKHTLIENTYQRVNKGVCRVGIQAELLYDCNYMMFQNKSFGTKWFYAFVNKVEYVNNNVSEIYFEIDVMQTWLPNLDYNIRPCFVEREHSVTDNVGDSLVPEPLGTGEHVISNFNEVLEGFDDKCVVVGISDVDGTIVSNDSYQVKLVNGVVSGLTYYVYNANDLEPLKTLLNLFFEKPEAIVTMYMVPKMCFGENIKTGGRLTDEFLNGLMYNVKIDEPLKNASFEGYVPKNNKLYTYPFNYLSVDNCNGDTLTLRYEFFKDNTPQFEIATTMIQPVEISLRPRSYRGLKDGNVSTSECLTLSNFPTCSWANDSFSSWLGKNVFNISSNIIQGLLGIATSMCTGSVQSATASTGKAQKIQNVYETNKNMSTIENVGGGITNTLSSTANAYISADTLNGRQSNNVNWANGKQQFYYYRKHITYDMAKSIDDYFSMFGYQTNKVKVPNISSRPLWNYVKTNGFTMCGELSNNDINLISSIFDSGITFWKNGDYVGMYQIDNTPS